MRRHETTFALVPWLVVVALVVATMAAVGAVASIHHHEQHHGWSHGRCFPRSYWTPPAPNRYRPCARIVSVMEDGSVTVAVSDHDGTERFRFDYGAADR